jgi:hypothetical protein
LRSTLRERGVEYGLKLNERMSATRIKFVKDIDVESVNILLFFL